MKIIQVQMILVLGSEVIQFISQNTILFSLTKIVFERNFFLT